MAAKVGNTLYLAGNGRMFSGKLELNLSIEQGLSKAAREIGDRNYLLYWKQANGGDLAEYKQLSQVLGNGQNSRPDSTDNRKSSMDFRIWW